VSDGQTNAPTIVSQRADRGYEWNDDDGDRQLTALMASVHPVLLVRCGRGGWEREGTILFILSSVIDKPVRNTGVGGLRVPEFLEMGEYLLSFFLLGGLVSVMEVICGMNNGHCLFRLKGVMDGLPLRKAFPVRENLKAFSVFDEPASGCRPFSMAGVRFERPRWVFTSLYSNPRWDTVTPLRDPGILIGRAHYLGSHRSRHTCLICVFR